MRVTEFCDFIVKRENIRLARELGKPRDKWTKDEILARYRFCNVRREDDKVTKWLAVHWRGPHLHDPDLWFAFCVARMATNFIPTMEELGYPVPWNRRRFVAVLQGRQSKGLPTYGPAYMIGTQGNAGNKAEFLADKLLTPLWNARKRVRPQTGDTLAAFHERLLPFYAVGTFTAAQVIADVKYAPPLIDAADWHTWAASGPGSRRGLNRVCERGVDDPWPGNTWAASHAALLALVVERLPSIALHGQDVQNCLCEFDKYERARLDEGAPKQLYKEVA